MIRLKRTYSSREVAAATGLSGRQLQIWDAGGLLRSAIPSRPTSRGGHTERRYTPIELFELMVLGELRGRGFSVPQLHAVIQALNRYFQATLFEATGGGGHVQLLTDNRAIYARTKDGEFYNLLESPGQPLLVVGDEGLLKALGGKVRRRTKRAEKRRGKD